MFRKQGFFFFVACKVKWIEKIGPLFWQNFFFITLWTLSFYDHSFQLAWVLKVGFLARSIEFTWSGFTRFKARTSNWAERIPFKFSVISSICTMPRFLKRTQNWIHFKKLIFLHLYPKLEIAHSEFERFKSQFDLGPLKNEGTSRNFHSQSKKSNFFSVAFVPILFYSPAQSSQNSKLPVRFPFISVQLGPHMVRMTLEPQKRQWANDLQNVNCRGENNPFLLMKFFAHCTQL